jgi:hypothetical protein
MFNIQCLFRILSDFVHFFLRTYTILLSHSDSQICTFVHVMSIQKVEFKSGKVPEVSASVQDTLRGTLDEDLGSVSDSAVDFTNQFSSQFKNKS